MVLNAGDQKKIIELYENRFKSYGRDHRTVGWGSRKDQNLRFEMLIRDLNLEGKRILDVGCGLGDLVSFLQERLVEFSYVGIDVAGKLVEDARNRYQGNNCDFLTGDFLSLPEERIGKIDFAILSGTLSYRILDNIAYTRKTIKKMYRLSESAACCNFLTSYADFEDPDNFHFKPEEIFSFCKKLSRWVTLYHDYPLWEFTIQIKKYCRGV